MTISKEELEQLRKTYTKGADVVLVKMDDPYRVMPAGLRGKVRCVDDTGTIHVNWENGSSLGAVYGEDVIKLAKGK